MRKKTSQKFSAYLTYEVFRSDAFRALRPASRDILILLYFEVEMKKSKNRGKSDRVITNRREIKLPYEEIKGALYYSKKTIWEAFQQLLAHGFIEVIHQGGGAKGDTNVYGITEDWRHWKPGMVFRTMQTSGKIGWQDREKISSTVGNPDHSIVGNLVDSKNKGRFPVRNPSPTVLSTSQDLG